MKAFKVIFLLTAFLTTLLTPAQAISELAELTNFYCPVTLIDDEVEEEVDPDLSVTHNGQQIYFCCKKCIRKFNQNPQLYSLNLHMGNFREYNSNPTKYLAGLELSKLDGTMDEHHDLSEEHGHGEEPKANGHDHATDHGGGHDHATDHGESRGLSVDAIISYVGKFHILAIHFPIALWLIAAFLEMVQLRIASPGLNFAKMFNLYFASIFAVVAAALGWAAASGASYPGMEQTLFLHRWMGTSMAVIAVVTSLVYWLFIAKGKDQWRPFYRVLLWGGAALIGVTSHFGGTLIYGADYFKF